MSSKSLLPLFAALVLSGCVVARRPRLRCGGGARAAGHRRVRCPPVLLSRRFLLLLPCQRPGLALFAPQERAVESAAAGPLSKRGSLQVSFRLGRPL